MKQYKYKNRFQVWLKKKDGTEMIPLTKEETERLCHAISPEVKEMNGNVIEYASDVNLFVFLFDSLKINNQLHLELINLLKRRGNYDVCFSISYKILYLENRDWQNELCVVCRYNEALDLLYMNNATEGLSEISF